MSNAERTFGIIMATLLTLLVLFAFLNSVYSLLKGEATGYAQGVRYETYVESAYGEY